MFDTVNFKAPFDAGGGIPQNTYDLVGRVDYNFTDKTQMFFRGGREASIQASRIQHLQCLSPVRHRHHISEPELSLQCLSHLHAQPVSKRQGELYALQRKQLFDQSLLYVPNLMFVSPTDPNTGALIQMPGLDNFSEPGVGGLPAGGPQNTIQLEPDLSWTKGKHSMRFGFWRHTSS
jgi:hypothetical protein